MPLFLSPCRKLMGIPPLPASLPRRFFALITTLFLSFFPVGLAGLPAVLDGHPAEAYAGEPSAHGFLQGNYSLNTAAQNPDGKDFKWAEVRGQIKLDAPGETLRLFIKTDISYDHIDGDGGGELREGYLDVTGKNW
ncbi:MAG: hypothetical protein HY890_00815, partial [Deltaproteobacteria bacterium]|nr:hypothetical protein [Deltaproteobacteria bacterium]